MDGKSKSNCKIRKRACSSSSSSSLVRRYRLKRAILVGKRTGSSTPVPIWKSGPISPPLVVNSVVAGDIVNAKRGHMSVRKLGATLWGINEVPSHSVKENAAEEKIGRRLSHSGSLLPSMNSLLPERMEQSGGGGKHRRRASTASQKLQIIDSIAGGGQDYDSSASVMELLQTEEPHRTTKHHGGGGRLSDAKLRLKDLGNTLTTSKEVLKVLYRVGGFSKHHHPSTISIISALKAELDRGYSQVSELIHDHRSFESEIEFLVRSFAEEKAGWREKERDKIRSAIGHVTEELEVEKKLRRQTERLNKKLGKELSDTKAALSNVVKELECEKRAKDILEQVCDELSRGIGEDRAQVEELKRESAKVIEEVEKEREMLQLADVLREERVQMKLTEAKYDFEEKNAAVERLKSELESYLQSKLPPGEENKSPKFEKLEEFYDDGSGESDLQSIELSMDNATRSYKWSYEKGIEEEEGIEPRRSLSEKIQWGSISLKKGPANSEPGSNGSENLNGFDRERLLEFVSQAHTKNNIPISATSMKGQHKAAVSGFGVVAGHLVASPIQKWGQIFSLSDPFKEKENSLIVLPGNDPTPKSPERTIWA